MSITQDEIIRCKPSPIKELTLRISRFDREDIIAYWNYVKSLGLCPIRTNSGKMAVITVYERL